MKELLNYLITSILKEPEKAEIIHQQEENQTLFIIKVPKDEIGAVIGSGGKTIRAIKTLLSLKSKGEQFQIEIKEA